MKIVKAGHKSIQRKDFDSPYKFIEKIGRTCYKSEYKITQDSAVKFCMGLKSRKHYAMLEHEWVHFECTLSYYEEKMMKGLSYIDDKLKEVGRHSCLKFLEMTKIGALVWVSCPIRVFVELDDVLADVPENEIPVEVIEIMQTFQYEYEDILGSSYSLLSHGDIRISLVYYNTMVENMTDQFNRNNAGANTVKSLETEIMRHTPQTVIFTCDRGVSHELVRHRVCSFAQESTRYCNYSKDKFGQEITVIDPVALSFNDGAYRAWFKSCSVAEEEYFNMVKIMGCTPQEARSVLPNSLKTEIVVTCNEIEWQHIVNLRAKGTTGAPHPQMLEIMTPYYEELKTLSDGRIK